MNDYSRWRERAIKDVKEGKQIRPFASMLIPDNEYVRIYNGLQQCTTADEVRAIFGVAKLQIAEPEQVEVSERDRAASDRRHYLRFLLKP